MREHEHWHLIALEDLDSAKHLFVRSFMTTLFHTQQCAEKALKSFEILRPLAAELNPYETAGRYPDSSFKKPNQEIIQNLIEQSEYIFNFVTDRISRK